MFCVIVFPFIILRRVSHHLKILLHVLSHFQDFDFKPNFRRYFDRRHEHWSHCVQFCPSRGKFHHFFISGAWAWSPASRGSTRLTAGRRRRPSPSQNSGAASAGQRARHRRRGPGGWSRGGRGPSWTPASRSRAGSWTRWRSSSWGHPGWASLQRAAPGTCCGPRRRSHRDWRSDLKNEAGIRICNV